VGGGNNISTSIAVSGGATPRKQPTGEKKKSNNQPEVAVSALQCNAVSGGQPPT